MRLFFAVTVVSLVACGVESESSELGEVEVPAAVSAAVSGLNSDASVYASQLVAADAVDGTVDHVVTQCAGCGLGMAGDPSHAAEIGEYELHLCSESCQGNFVSDPGAVLGRLPID